jgi:hypothetical protein
MVVLLRRQSAAVGRLTNTQLFYFIWRASDTGRDDCDMSNVLNIFLLYYPFYLPVLFDRELSFQHYETWYIAATFNRFITIQD